MTVRRVVLSFTIALAVLAIGFFMLRVGAGNLVGSGQAYAEKTAVATLRTLHWGQGIFRNAARIDTDANGVGEFGTMGQLAGIAPLPSGETLASPLIPPAATTVVDGVLEAGGYCFRFDLPEGAHARERRFVAWAWPKAEGAGTKAFCLDQDEEIFEGSAEGRFGCDAGPPPLPCPPGDAFVRWKGKTNKRPVGAP